MLKKTIKFDDFNDQPQEEDFYFHLSRADLIKLELTHEGGLSKSIDRIVQAQDGAAIIKEFEEIIKLSYGRRSADGKKFERNEEIWRDFHESNAYDALFMELCTDADAAAAFVQAVVPKGLIDQAAAVAAQQKLAMDLGPEPVVNVQVMTKAELTEMPPAEYAKTAEKIATGEIVIQG